MFIDLVDSERLAKGKWEDYRREAKEYQLAKEANGQRTGLSANAKMGLALIAIISFLAIVGQFASA